jgi:hypothetical protein
MLWIQESSPTVLNLTYQIGDKEQNPSINKDQIYFSAQEMVKHGVTQDSVLGPLLHCIQYI